MLSNRTKRVLAAITLTFGAASASANTIGTDFTITIVDDKTLTISAVDGGAALGSPSAKASAYVLYLDVGIVLENTAHGTAGNVSDNDLKNANGYDPRSLVSIAYWNRSTSFDGVQNSLAMSFGTNLGTYHSFGGSATVSFDAAHGLTFNEGDASLNTFNVIWGHGGASAPLPNGPTVGTVSIVNAQSTVSAVPLPAAAPLLLSGLGFAAYGARRRRKAAQ